VTSPFTLSLATMFWRALIEISSSSFPTSMPCALSEKRPSVVMSTRAACFAGGGGAASAAGGAGGASGAGGRPPGPVSGVDTPPCAAFAPGAPHTALRGSVAGDAAGSAAGAGAPEEGGDCGAGAAAGGAACGAHGDAPDAWRAPAASAARAAATNAARGNGRSTREDAVTCVAMRPRSADAEAAPSDGFIGARSPAPSMTFSR
jgi:hypothetical protein